MPPHLSFLPLLRRRLKSSTSSLSVLALLALWLALFASTGAYALTAESAQRMAIGEADERIAAIAATVVAEPDERTAAFLQALANDAVKFKGQQVFVLKEAKATDPVTGQALTLPEDAEEVINNNQVRAQLDMALSAIQLFATDVNLRRQAAASLAKEASPELLPLFAKALATESDAEVKASLTLAQAGAQLGSADPAQRIAAAQQLAKSPSPATQLLLNEALGRESEPQVKAALSAALRRMADALKTGEVLGTLFTGISLGSVLLLVALGLAITYGLMGVINMAHGELMMIGAYATYVVQGLFRQHLPTAFDWYLLAALPVAFTASALVGAALERGVLRFLYGRPLESLLATWGISLVLMQAVRSVFGAQNVGVENPSWMSGGVQVLSNLTLPYNRLVIIAFAAAVLLGMAWLIGRTRLGLFVRGVTQNRPMASCMGVNTARIDTYAFALGSGIAGLAGCALTQVGNVGPDLGQSYIVDAFMVVVVGGVGQLAGAVYAALGLGMTAKLLEGWTGAVLAKITVLLFIIIFIQKRPQGIFAMKGRSAEA